MLTKGARISLTIDSNISAAILLQAEQDGSCTIWSMAEEGALAERALTTAWDAFEERFSWESFSDLSLLGRLCLCSRALATVNAVRGPSPIVGRITIAEEEVRFAILLALREVFRQLLKRAGLEHAPPHSKCSNRSSSGGSHTPDPGSRTPFA